MYKMVSHGFCFACAWSVIRLRMFFKEYAYFLFSVMPVHVEVRFLNKVVILIATWLSPMSYFSIAYKLQRVIILDVLLKQ